MEQKAIENKKFLSKNKIIVGVILIAISITLIALTLVFVLQIDFVRLFNNIVAGVENNKLAGLYLFLLMFFILYKIFYYAGPMMIRFAKLGIKICWWEWITYSCICTFIAGITPTAAGSEPYTIYWLHTKGLPTHKATALVFSNSFIIQSIIFILALPCFIYVCIYSSNILAISSGTGWLVITIIVLGMFLTFVMLFFYIMLGWSKKVHYYLSRIWNQTKKIIHLSYHTKDQTRKTYLENQTLKQDFLCFIKDYKLTFLIGGFVLGMYTYFYSCMYMSADLVINVDHMGEMNFLVLFACTDIAVAASGYIPLPGGEGPLQIALKGLLLAVGEPISGEGGREALTIAADDAIVLWRGITFYFPVLLSLIPIAGLGIKIAIEKSTKRKISKKLNQQTVSVLD